VSSTPSSSACRLSSGKPRKQFSDPVERLAIQENLFTPLIEECTRQNCRDAIVDARELQVDFNTIAMFRAGVDAASLNAFGLRVALVARPDMMSSFFEDVTHNRCAQVQVFTDPESARAWIQERRPVQAA
jgi:hypothetical protein